MSRHVLYVHAFTRTHIYNCCSDCSSMATAADLLKEVIDGASRARGNIQLKDVERVLGSETFTKDMLVTSESGVRC